MFQIGRNKFYDQNIKILIKIQEFKRFRIRIIAEFHRIQSGFLNQGPDPLAQASWRPTSASEGEE